METNFTNTAKTNEKLRQNIKFTKDDLALNKQGVLSPIQIEQVKNNVQFSKTSNLKLMAAIAIFSLIIAFSKGAFKDAPPQTFLYFIGMIAAYGLFFFGYNHYKLQRIIKGKIKVETLQGKVNLFYDNAALQGMSAVRGGAMLKTAMSATGVNSADYAYVVQVGDKKIYTDKATYEAFENGKEYTVYYVRQIKTVHKNLLLSAIIVAAEAI